jgi:antitoxin component YwqK of YwqJK toxin-antitoxin module
MKLNILLIVTLLIISPLIKCQTETDINKTDQNGKKQGLWIKTFPNKSIMYEGHFKNGHPVNEFRRYYENSTLRSLLIFSNDGIEAIGTFYHPNGYLSSKGLYINQKKEGKWQFYSKYIKEYLISEDQYIGNIRNGLSVKYYPDGSIAERINYINDIKQGEWLQYYPSGAICLKSNYHNEKIDGKYEVWFENGQIQFSGQYKNDARDGKWYIYNEDGTIKYDMEYNQGVTNNRQMDIDESEYLDSLGKNQGKIADPEKTGIMW